MATDEYGGAALKPPRKDKRISPSQVRGMDRYPTYMLYPVYLQDGAEWWSADDVLVGGVKVNGTAEKGAEVCIGFCPTLIPLSWGQKDFAVMVQFEAEEARSRFKLKCYYGCGDPSSLQLGVTPYIEGQCGRSHAQFDLSPQHLNRNELLRVTLGVLRETLDPVIIYGAWLAIGV